MARFIAQIIVVGSQAVARAFTQALKQEYQASAATRRAAAEAGKDGSKTVKANTFTGMSLQEAQQILNVQDVQDLEKLRKNYEHLFKMNDKTIGGSFYLQSKIVRAKERLEMELDQKIIPDQISEATKDESNSNSQHS